MFYFVDESGNTGLNLFDENQPILYYGVLGARTNLNIVAHPLLEGLRKELGVKRIHANELGVAKLTTIAKRLAQFSKKYDLRFSLFTVNKTDHAIITYFDQVFDAGLNDAVAWHHYWTPLRYALLFKVAHLFDDEIAKEAWRARCEQNPARCTEMLKGVHQKLLAKLHTLPDARSREILEGAIKWADANPEAIGFGSSNHESTLQISPNLIGYQAVLHGVSIQAAAMRRTVRRITVDRQTQFNGAQAELAEFYQQLRGHKTNMGPGMPEFDYSILPEMQPDFISGDESAGLELVDISLWIAKRLREDRPLSLELKDLLWTQARRGLKDEVSLAALHSRWRFLSDLPEPNPNNPVPKNVQKMFDDMEKRRREAVAGL